MDVSARSARRKFSVCNVRLVSWGGIGITIILIVEWPGIPRKVSVKYINVLSHAYETKASDFTHSLSACVVVSLPTLSCALSHAISTCWGNPVWISVLGIAWGLIAGHVRWSFSLPRSYPRSQTRELRSVRLGLCRTVRTLTKNVHRMVSFL